MKLILILAVLTLMFLPVLAVEPVNVGGTFGSTWMNRSVSKNPDLGGNPLYSNFYTRGGPYGRWMPLMLYYPNTTLYYPNNFYSSGYPYNRSLNTTLYYPNDFYFSGYPYNRSLEPNSFSVNRSPSEDWQNRSWRSKLLKLFWAPIQYQ